MTCAAYYGHTDVIRELIENGADVNLVSVGWAWTGWSCRPLHTTPLSLAHMPASPPRPYPNQVRMDGTSPLWLAANAPDEGGEAAALELLEAGAKADIVGSRGGTALHGAAFHGRAKLASALIDAGCPVNAVNSKTSYTALHTAAETKHPKVRGCQGWWRPLLAWGLCFGSCERTAAWRSKHPALLGVLPPLLNRWSRCWLRLAPTSTYRRTGAGRRS
jgi:hypothetical protein